MAESVIVYPSADGGEPVVEDNSLGAKVPQFEQKIAEQQAQQRSLAIQDHLGGQLPPNPTTAQLQRAQMLPIYKANTPEGAAFRAAVAAGYAAQGRQVQKPGDVIQSEDGRVDMAKEGEADSDDAMQKAEAENQALSEMAFSDEDIGQYTDLINEIDIDMGDGTYNQIVEIMVDQGNLDEADLAHLAEQGYDAAALKAAGVELGGAVIAQVAGEMGFTGAALQQFAQVMEGHPDLSKQIAMEILTEGNTDTLRQVLQQFKDQVS